jgi:hypothetical protein
MRPSRSLHILLQQIVDYAGLFPPAALDLTAAVAEYAAHRAGAHRWMLGRFIVPAARLDEFGRAAEPCLPMGSDPWRVSALAGADLPADLAAIARFNRSWRDRAVVDAFELKAADSAPAASALGTIDSSLDRYVELPVHADLRPLLRTLAEHGARAKIRTGGVTAGAFPEPAAVLRFIRAALDEQVGFKATAGLHHPLGGSYALTYEPASARAPMYGFLNLFLTAAFMAQGMADADAAALLAESSAEAFRFSDDAVQWGDLTLPAAELQRVRQHVAISFGSCSFREPVADLQAIGLL